MSAVWRRGRVTWRAVPGFVTIGRPDLDQVWCWTGSAALIWDLLDQPQTVGALTTLTAAHVGRQPAQISTDVNALINQWHDLGLIEATADDS